MVVVLFVVWSGCFCLFVFQVNPVTGALSLLWFCLDSKDCHGRYDERSNRSEKPFGLPSGPGYYESRELRIRSFEFMLRDRSFEEQDMRLLEEQSDANNRLKQQKIATKHINELDQRRRSQKSVGSKLVPGEDRKNGWLRGSFTGDGGALKALPRGERVARNP